MKCFIHEDKISSGWEQLHLISIRTHAIIPPEEGEEERQNMRAGRRKEEKSWESNWAVGKKKLRSVLESEWVSEEASHRVYPPHGYMMDNDAVLYSLWYEQKFN